MHLFLCRALKTFTFGDISCGILTAMIRKVKSFRIVDGKGAGTLCTAAVTALAVAADTSFCQQARNQNLNVKEM